MTDHTTILRRARALCEGDERLCAHIAIFDAAYLPPCADSLTEREDLCALAKETYACANGLDINDLPRCIHRHWDATDDAEHAASWDRAIAAAEQRAAVWERVT